MASHSNQLLESALQYAARGWRVFPLHSVWHRSVDEAVCTCRRGVECISKGKHPRIKEGFKGATTDQKIIEEWWGKWPQANVGIATGQGLTVMDIDGEKGRDELLALLEAHRGEGKLGTLAARTGNGGHLYWALEGARSAAKGNLHVRGEGGYVVAPPSMHQTGRQYEWINNSSVLIPPNWLATWLLAGGDSAGKKDKSRLVNGNSVGILALGPPPSWLIGREANGRSKVAGEAEIRTPWSAHEEARLRAALKAIPASIDGKTWASIGRALHDLGWDCALEMWDEWSRESQGRGEGLGLYKGREDLEKRWAGFSRGGTTGKAFTIGSVYHLAKEHGWAGGSEGKGVNGHAFDFQKHFGGGTNGVVSSASFVSAGGGPIFIDLDRWGNPRPTCVNSRVAIRALGVECRWDMFHDKLKVGGQPIGQWAGELTDNAVHVLRGMIHGQFGFDPGTVAAHDAAMQECLGHGYDPVADYLDGLRWDGKARLTGWLSEYMGAEQSQLNNTIGALGLIAACRRVRVPGAKFDAITVLISDEGFGKSSAIEILAGENNFSDAPILNIDERAQQEAMQGVWLYEIADLAGMSKADTDKVKAFASRRIDRARPAYARTRMDRPRRCVFYATTNLRTFLKSQTGNRRFWPVQVGKIKTVELERDRDQLWAEASAIERAGVPLGLPEVLWGEATKMQMERVELDPWDEVIADVTPKETYVCTSPGGTWKEWRITSRDLFEVHLKLPIDRQHDGMYKRLAYAMRRNNWDGPKTLRFRNGEKTLTAKGFAKVLPG